MKIVAARFAVILLVLCISGCTGNYISRVNPVAGLPDVITTNARGGYVALAFSKAANKVYLGRSSSSSADALNVAVVGCKYSDCREFSVTEHNGCVAFAANVDKERRWGKGSRANAEDAKTVAVKHCNAALLVDNCVPVVVHCPEY